MQGWSLFATSFLVGLSGAVIPGPLMTVAIAGVGRLGASSGFVAAAGHAVPETLMVVALAYGFGSVLQIPLVGGLIAIVGGAILVWMAVGMFRSAASVGIGPAAVAASGRLHWAPSWQGRQALAVIASGALASVFNPYWILWWATIGAGYVTQALASGWAGVGTFFGGHILSDVAWLGFMGSMIAAGSRALSPAFYKWLVRILALFLVALAGYFLLTGYRLLTVR